MDNPLSAAVDREEDRAPDMLAKVHEGVPSPICPIRSETTPYVVPDDRKVGCVHGHVEVPLGSTGALVAPERSCVRESSVGNCVLLNMRHLEHAG